MNGCCNLITPGLRAKPSHEYGIQYDMAERVGLLVANFVFLTAGDLCPVLTPATRRLLGSVKPPHSTPMVAIFAFPAASAS
jgi:hypothetical protein